MKEEIKEYYNELAREYDTSRFSNSYGQYIHKQELRIINKYIDRETEQFNLDVACGTGRFLEYATHGIDISEEMLKIAKSKYPNLNLQVASGDNLPFENGFFQNVTAFHLMMHLEKELVGRILDEVHRVTKRNGYFIFDIPSEKRRHITKYSAKSWHGGTQLSVKDVKELVLEKWKLVNFHGVSYLPIHRVPKSLRSKVIGLDNYLSDSLFKEYASYLVFILQKR